MAIQIDSTDAHALVDLLEKLEELLPKLQSAEAWVVTPIMIDSELMGGLYGKVDYNENGTLSYYPLERPTAQEDVA